MVMTGAPMPILVQEPAVLALASFSPYTYQAEILPLPIDAAEEEDERNLDTTAQAHWHRRSQLKREKRDHDLFIVYL